MFDWLTNHHIVQAGNLNFAVISLLCAWGSAYHIRRYMKAHGLEIWDVLLEDNLRAMCGHVLYALAVAMRIGFWLWWRPALYACDMQAANQYASQAGPVTFSTAILAAVGMSMIWYPTLSYRFRRLALLTPFVAVALLSVLGVLSIELLSMNFGASIIEVFDARCAAIFEAEGLK